VAQDNIGFTVNIPAPTPKPSTGGGGWWASWKTHYNNNLKVSLGNDSPTTSDWVKLIIKIDEKYTGKGIAKRLVYKLIQEAERSKNAIDATCSYAAKILGE
jgi:GNAT superfamily N-acetyltransferase